MRNKRINSILTALAVTLALCGPTFAQNLETRSASTGTGTHVNTTSRITYHDGPLMYGTSNVYFVWYGCWDETCRAGNTATQRIIEEFTSSVGGSPYFQINAMYPGAWGNTPSGGLIFGGSVVDRYSHGFELTAADIRGIVEDGIESNQLPQDPSSIYVVLASADVSSNTTGFCIPGALPHHGIGEAFGSQIRYAFVGNALRCPSVAASQFVASNGTLLPTPNGNLAADAMVSTLAHLLNVIVTNPAFGGWFDRYGLQNADKCFGEFGPTWLVNGARANLKLGGRDYLIQQNWVNSDKKPHCAMNSSL